MTRTLWFGTARLLLCRRLPHLGQLFLSLRGVYVESYDCRMTIATQDCVLRQTQWCKDRCRSGMLRFGSCIGEHRPCCQCCDLAISETIARSLSVTGCVAQTARACQRLVHTYSLHPSKLIKGRSGIWHDTAPNCTGRSPVTNEASVPHLVLVQEQLSTCD